MFQIQSQISNLSFSFFILLFQTRANLMAMIEKAHQDIIAVDVKVEESTPASDIKTLESLEAVLVANPQGIPNFEMSESKVIRSDECRKWQSRKAPE